MTINATSESLAMKTAWNEIEHLIFQDDADVCEEDIRIILAVGLELAVSGGYSDTRISKESEIACDRIFAAFKGRVHRLRPETYIGIGQKRAALRVIQAIQDRVDYALDNFHYPCDQCDETTVPHQGARIPLADMLAAELYAANSHSLNPTTRSDWGNMEIDALTDNVKMVMYSHLNDDGEIRFPTENEEDDVWKYIDDFVKHRPIDRFTGDRSSVLDSAWEMWSAMARQLAEEVSYYTQHTQHRLADHEGILGAAKLRAERMHPLPLC